MRLNDTEKLVGRILLLFRRKSHVPSSTNSVSTCCRYSESNFLFNFVQTEMELLSSLVNFIMLSFSSWLELPCSCERIKSQWLFKGIILTPRCALMRQHSRFLHRLTHREFINVLIVDNTLESWHKLDEFMRISAWRQSSDQLPLLRFKVEKVF